MDIFTAMGLIAFLSSLGSFVVIQMKDTVAQTLSALIVPLVLSNMFYWSPCLSEPMCDEYFTWATLFLVPTFFSGVIAIFIGLYILKRRAKVESNS